MDSDNTTSETVSPLKRKRLHSSATPFSPTSANSDEMKIRCEKTTWVVRKKVLEEFDETVLESTNFIC